MNNDCSNLKRYLRPSYTALILPGFLLLFGACSLIVDMGIAHPFALFLMTAVMALFLSLSFFKDMSHLSSTIDKYKDSGELPNLLSEFESGHRAVNDSIRVSDSYLFGKKTATLVRYEEIRKIYMYVHTTNGAEDKRALKIETHDGKTRMLCTLPVHTFRNKTDHPDVNKILKVVLLKNPSVQVGYK